MSHAQKLDSSSFDALLELFSELHALPGGHHLSKKQPHLLNESLNSLVNESYEIEESVQLGDYLEERRMAAFVFKLEEMLQKQNLQFSINTGISLPPGQFDLHGTFFDPLISRQNQILRINEYKSTLEFKKGAGSRMLFLDGGGIRGLIQIEILSLIENMTGRKITELFDWIVGTSTGGIIALALVYCKYPIYNNNYIYINYVYVKFWEKFANFVLHCKQCKGSTFIKIIKIHKNFITIILGYIALLVYCVFYFSFFFSHFLFSSSSS